jgi:hypothetical protein
MIWAMVVQLVMDLHGGLADQEEASEQQDEIAPRDVVPQHREERPRELHDPGDAEQQQDARDERPRQPQRAGLGLLLGRQLTGENGDENDVVDAEHDLEHRQREQGNPRLRIGNPIEHVRTVVRSGGQGNWTASSRPPDGPR